MKKEIYYLLVLSVLYCALIAADENDTTAAAPVTQEMADPKNNTGMGSIHGSHSGYNAWYFLTTVSMVVMLLVNRMNF